MRTTIALMALMAVATQASCVLTANKVMAANSTIRALAAMESQSAAVVTSQSTSTMSTTSSPDVAIQNVKIVNPQEACKTKCNKDVNCIADCVGVPHPNNAQMQGAVDCVGNCDLGDGSAASNARYGACREACISSNIVLVSVGTNGPGVEYTQTGVASEASAQSTKKVAGNATTSTVVVSSATLTVTATSKHGKTTATTKVAATTKASNGAAIAQVGAAGLVAVAGFVLF